MELMPHRSDFSHSPVLSHLSRMVYSDIRRVVPLAWAVVGLCLIRTMRLTVWVEDVELHMRRGTAPTNCNLFSTILFHFMEYTYSDAFVYIGSVACVV